MKNGVVEAIVEIPFRSRNKYEVDHESGKIKLDRVLYSGNCVKYESNTDKK